MRRLTKKQIIARLIIGLFTMTSMLCSVNTVRAESSEYGTYTINGEHNTLTETGVIPLSNSNNIIGVNITAIGEGHIPNYLYGGRSDVDGDIASNSISITRITDSQVSLSHVYGDGRLENNEITLSDSDVHYFSGTAGTFIDTPTNNESFAIGNVASISNSHGNMVGTVFINSEEAKNNEITITDSTIDFGAGASCIMKDGTAENNKTTIILILKAPSVSAKA